MARGVRPAESIWTHFADAVESAVQRPMRPPEPQPTGDLQGWKDIAAYMGRSVRAVQRWERELGLPVRRLKTAAGQVVFARRGELDAWRTANEIAPANGLSDRAVAVRAWERWRKRWGWVALLMGVSAAAAGSFMVRRDTAAPSASLRYVSDGPTLKALDANGKSVWERSFDHGYLAPPENEAWRHWFVRTVVADFNGTGHAEVLAFTSTVSEHERGTDRVYAFDALKGTPLWTYDPAIVFRFSGRVFSPPQVVKNAVVANDRGHDRVWIAVTDNKWWPGAIVELRGDGSAQVIFMQPGQSDVLAPFRTRNGIRLLVGGVNNAFASASLALVDPDHPAHAPDAPTRGFECSSCPAGLPLRYILFPPTELVGAEQLSYNSVYSLEFRNASTLVSTLEFHPSGTMEYTFNDDLTSATSAASDGFWAGHRRFELSGAISHAADHCPEKDALSVRIWDSQRGWNTIRTTPVGAVPPRVAGN